MSLGHIVLVLVLYVFTVMRLTRLINADTITDRLRIYVAERSQDDTASGTERARWGALLYFLGCPWCVGMWLALALAWVPVELIGWPVWTFIPLGLSASHLTGLSAQFADVDDTEIVHDDVD